MPNRQQCRPVELDASACGSIGTTSAHRVGKIRFRDGFLSKPLRSTFAATKYRAPGKKWALGVRLGRLVIRLEGERVPIPRGMSEGDGSSGERRTTSGGSDG